MKKYRGQFIGTRFVIIGIPLIPLQSYFFIGEYQSIEISLFGKQVARGYMFFISIIALILSFFNLKNPEFMLGRDVPTAVSGLLFLLCLAAFVYFGFLIGKMTDEEKELRELYGLASEINALPQYLGPIAANKIAQSLETRLQAQYNIDWRTVLQSGTYDSELVPLLFTLVGYKNYLSPDPTLLAAFNKLRAEYKALAKPTIDDTSIWSENF